MLTNFTRTVLYTGVTNDLEVRLQQHKEGNRKSFTAKYKCYYLVYYEHHSNINHAIEREKEIKGWTRIKKNQLIAQENEAWRFLNDEVLRED